MRTQHAVISLAALATGLAACTTVQPGPTPPGEPLSFGGPGLYGDVAFSGDATSTPVRAGGAISATELADECYGYINERPTLTASVSGGGSLYIAGTTGSDTVLIVRGPDGTFSCDDDGAGFPNPGVSFDEAAEGDYEIWLGTYGAGEGYPSGAVSLSSEAFVTTNPFLRSLDPSLPAGQSLELSAGFADDPRTVSVSAGGSVDMETASFDCYGYADEAADLSVTYSDAGIFDLYFFMESDEDGTLAVRTPSGEWVCNDDQVELNPGVRFSEPENGEYLVWAGLLYEEGSNADGVISVSEIGFSGVDNRMDLNAAPIHGSTTLVEGFLPDPHTVSVLAGGPIDADQGLGGLVVAEGYCSGYVTQAPSYELNYEAGESPLYIAATSFGDTTLVVNAPDGAWYCNDDAGMGVNSELVFTDPQSGVYDIYVGTFGGETGLDAELTISEIEGLPRAEQLDLSLPATAGNVSLAAGFLPDPHAIDVMAGGDADANYAMGEVQGLYCSGYVTLAPTVELDWSGNGGPLSFYVEADEDTTLVINDPDGSWYCDDDGSVGTDPGLTIEDGPSGIYDIYVGRFFDQGEMSAARLMITEGAYPSP